MNDSSVTPDVAGLRALSHPARLRMLGLLRMEGPATATTLAQRLGLNTGATSYHLRQLAQHGFIEDDADRGTGRERWWRAAHSATRTTPTTAASEEDHDTFDAFLQAVAVTHAQDVQRSVAQRRALPEEWQDAGTLSDWVPTLTPARARELKERLAEVVEGFTDDDAPDALPFVVNLHTYLQPDAAERVRTEHREDPATGEDRS